MLNTINISQNKQKFFIYVVLVLVTLAVYWQVHQFDFVNIDDNFYVIENFQIKSGITSAGIHWAFNGTDKLWTPLLWFSFMLDYQLYGLNAGGYHVTNLILHILSTLLLFWLFNRMTGAVWKSAFVAAFFALHPLHVESVAWVSERKDVLSAFFWMLTLCLYVVYAEKCDVKRYLLVLLSFVLALMSKPMVVTLPVIMILLDYWPLKRFQSQKDNVFLWQLKEKMPFFILSAVLSIVTFYDSKKIDIDFMHFPFISRLFNAFVSLSIYLGKTILPYDMAAFYPFPMQLPLLQIMGSIIFITLITIVVIIMAKRLPYLFVGWMWFMITILPVTGIIYQIFLCGMTDRYHYLPSIGLAVIMAWGIPLFLPNVNTRKKILCPAAIALLTILAFITWNQCSYWENSIKLWDHALKVTKNNFMAHGNLGVAMLTEGKNEQALEHFNKALLLKPDHILLYNNRGGAYAELGQYQSAFADFDKAIRLRPDYAGSYKCRGVVYFKIGQYQNAIKDFNACLSLNPNDAETYNYRGTAYSKLGQPQLAINDFHTSIIINPDFLEPYINMAAIYGKLDQYDKVIKILTTAIRLQPDNALFFYNRGFAYAKIRDYSNAIQDFNEVIKRNANYADAYNIRAASYLNMRSISAGCNDAKKACELGKCATLHTVINKGLCR